MTPLELLEVDHLLTVDERDIQAEVRDFVDRRVKPSIGDWYERGEVDLGLMKEAGSLGLLGMHLEGYGCAGTNAVSYGLACLELEAGDSGVRSMVSVQGSLAMFAIWKFGTEDQKNTWLPPMATGEAIGCFGLTEADFGSNPAGMRTRAKRDGDEWVLNGTKMWITNGSVADVAIVWAQTDEGIRGFVVPTASAGFSASKITKKLSLRASITSELVLEGVRLPAEAVLPDAVGLRGPLSCLNEARFGIVFGALGAARDCLEAALDYAGPGGLRSAAGLLPADTGEAGRHGAGTSEGLSPRPPSRATQGRPSAAATPGKASASSTTFARHSPSRGSAGRSSARAASRSSIRSCGTPTTWSPY